MPKQQLLKFSEPHEISGTLPDTAVKHHNPTPRELVLAPAAEVSKLVPAVKALAESVGIKTNGVPGVVARILSARGVTSEKFIQALIRPDLEPLPDPSLMKNFDAAVETICDAIRKGEKIGINGDYDVDGTTAVAQAIKLLNNAGSPYDWTIPHRELDGYGLSDRIVQKFIDSGCKLVLLFDHGSQSVQEIAKLRRAGIRVVVFDHHAIGPVLPDAVVVNPAQPECGFFDYKPCASGLSYFMAQRVSEILNLPPPDCGLAALGTMADMVPLVGPNRTLEYRGARDLRTGACRGVSHLASQLSLCLGTLSSADVAFYIGPAINAAGRLDNATRCVELLSGTDEVALQRLGRELVEMNESRKEIQRRQLLRNYDRLASLPNVPPVLVSSNSEHHQGVVGLTAQGLAQRHARPAFVFAPGGNGTLKGSARAGSEQYDLVRMLADAKSCDRDGVILKSGGHKNAAGVTIREDGLAQFTKLIIQAAAQQSKEPPRVVRVTADVKLSFKELSARLVHDINILLDPFGQGWTSPKFLFEGVKVLEVDEYQGGRRMLVLDQGERKMRAFVGPEQWDGSISPGCVIDLIATPAAIYRNDKHHVQLSVDGFAVTSPTTLQGKECIAAAAQDQAGSSQSRKFQVLRSPPVLRPTTPREDRRDIGPPKYARLLEGVAQAMADLPRSFLYPDLEGLVSEPFGPDITPQLRAARDALIREHGLSALHPESFTVRPEQLEFIRWFLERSDNAILQAPTGSGKTEMALVIASKQRSLGRRTFFCAPTIEIQQQVSQRAPQMIDVDVTLLGGEISPKKREKLYKDSELAFVSAVPHVLKNDIKSGTFSFRSTDLLIIDEGHHTTGEYPYVPLIRKARETGARVLLLSATPGQVESGKSWDKFQSLKELVGIRNIFPINLVRRQPVVRPQHVDLSHDIKLAIGDLSKRLESLRTDVMDYVHTNGEPELIREAGTLLGTTTLTFPTANTLGPLMERVRTMNNDSGRWKVISALCAMIELSELYQNLAYQGISGFLLRVVEKRFEVTFPVAAARSSTGRRSLAPNGALLRVYRSSEVECAYRRLAQGPFVGLWDFRSLEKVSGLSLQGWESKTPKERRSSFYQRVSAALKKLSDELETLPYSDHPKEQYMFNAVASLSRNQQAIAFVRDRAHALFLPSRLSHHGRDEGLTAVALTGSGQGIKRGLSKEQRKQSLDDLAAGRAQVIVTTSAGNEGIDFARVQKGFAYRFSASPIEALQQWGRVGRREFAGEITYLCSTPEEHGKFLSILRKVTEFYRMLNHERQAILDIYGK